MANTLLLKRSGTAAAVPLAANIALGELAINYADGNLFYKDSGGLVKVIASNQFSSVVGNVTGGNINTSGLVSATGNIIGGNISTVGNVTGNYILGNGALLTGVITSVANINNGTSNVTVVSSGGNVTVGIGGTSNVAVFATTGEYITGLLSVSGNITGGNLSGTNIVGTLTTASQTNITGLGNVTTGTWSATPVGLAYGGTGKTSAPAAMAALMGYTSTVTAAGTTTLTNTSSYYQQFTGTSTQTVVLPVTSTLQTGWTFHVVNNSTGNVTVQSSGLNQVIVVIPGTTAMVTCISTATTTAADWEAGLTDFSTYTGTGAVVFGTSPVLTTPNVGAAIGTSVSVTANVNGGNLVSAALVQGVTVSASGNVIGGNVTTGGLISATGNITGGNLVTGGLISATGAVNAGGDLSLVGNIVDTGPLWINTSLNGNINLNPNGTGQTNIPVGILNVTANVVGGNILTAGLMSATGSITSAANVTGGNLLTGGIISATGNITGGNILGGANVNATTHTGTTVSVTANVNGGNLVSAALVQGVTVSASGNVIGGNVTTGGLVTATGNITGGNILTGGLISATGNVTGGNVNTNTLNGTGTTIKSAGNINLSATGNIILSTATYINNLSTPVQDADAANKGYVDSVAQGLDIKASVVWATVAALPAYTYNNGTSGVGATLTGNANGALSIDGNAVSATQRVLIKNETSTNAPYNGIYVVTNAGSAGAAYVLTRSTDFDNGTPSGEIPGAFTFVEDGTIADTGWVCTTNAPITVGTTNIVFAQFSGAGSYLAGTGLTLTGSTFSVNASQTQVTAVGTLGSLSVTGSTTSGNLLTGGNVSATGNVTGGNVLTGGAISATGNITGGNILGGANVNATTHTGGTVSVTGNVNGGNLISAALVQGVTVSASGNVVGGNINTAGLLSATGNVIGGNVSTAGLITATGNINGGNLIGAALVQGVTVSASGNVVGGNVSTAGLVTATGNITGGNVIGVALVQGVTVSASGNVVGGNINTAGLMSATGNISGANVNATTAMYVGGASVLTVNSTVDGGTY